jgi:hypothetical protein
MLSPSKMNGQLGDHFSQVTNLAQEPTSGTLTFSKKNDMPMQMYMPMSKAEQDESVLVTSIAAAKQSALVIFGFRAPDANSHCGFRVYDRVLREWVGDVQHVIDHSLSRHVSVGGGDDDGGDASEAEQAPFSRGNDDDNPEDGEVSTTRRPRGVSAVAITDDGSVAVIGLTDGTLQVWELTLATPGRPAENDAMLELNDGYREVDFVAISPDGARIAGSDVNTTKASVSM